MKPTLKGVAGILSAAQIETHTVIRKFHVTILPENKIRTFREFRILPQYHHRYTVAHLVEALCYKLDGHRFDSQWYNWNSSLT